jgi:murein peptide amidase A
LTAIDSVPGSNRRRPLALLSVAVTLAAITGCTSSTLTSAGAAKPGHQRTTQPVTTRVDASVRRMLVLGYSVRHRPISAIEIGDPDSPDRTIIVGCIHGSEPAGIAIARALAAGPVPAGAELWIIPDLNPDGVAAGTRDNARGDDLNRNFPYRWQPLGPPGSPFYAGPHPLSEPESRIAAALVRRLRPRLTIYYHQHLGVVDDSQGPRSIERRYARVAGLPLSRLSDDPGSATGWQDHLLGPTAFVVELPAGALSARQVRANVAAVRAVLPRA